MSRNVYTVSDVSSFIPRPQQQPQFELYEIQGPQKSTAEAFEPVKQSIYGNRRFEENHQYAISKDEYARDGQDPGQVFIFNYQQFDNYNKLKVRMGTNRDVNELSTTFGRLGFNITKDHIFTNLTRQKTVDKLTEISERDFSNTNSLIVIVLTHGNIEDELETKDAMIKTNEFLIPFSSVESLKDKPKFFIFQACKGTGYSHTETVDTKLIPNSIVRMPLDSDMLIAFAAVEGSQSYRHLFNGTWFIQELCRNFSVFGRRDDVVSLLIRTAKCVATNYYDETTNESEMVDGKEPSLLVKKQMPMFLSTLSKKFYLNRNKDRDLLLQFVKQQNELKVAQMEKKEKPVNEKKRWK